jgi:hypothetical protein
MFFGGASCFWCVGRKLFGSQYILWDIDMLGVPPLQLPKSSQAQFTCLHEQNDQTRD